MAHLKVVFINRGQEESGFGYIFNIIYIFKMVYYRVYNLNRMIDREKKKKWKILRGEVMDLEIVWNSQKFIISIKTLTFYQTLIRYYFFESDTLTNALKSSC